MRRLALCLLLFAAAASPQAVVAFLFMFCVSAVAQPQPTPTRPAFKAAQSLGTDSICAKGADGTLFIDGSLKTVTVVTGADTSLPSSGTWTTTGGAGTGASGTFTATAGNLSTVTIVAKGSGYTSNPTWVPSSGAKGTSTVTFSGCANQADGTAETAFSTTVIIPVNTLSTGVSVPMSLLFGTVTSGAPPNITLKIRLGGIGGTTIFQTPTTVATTASSVNRIWQFPCRLTAFGAAATTTPTQTGCAAPATGGSLTSNTVPTAATLTTAVNATISQTVTVTVSWAANTAGNVIYLYSISPI